VETGLVQQVLTVVADCILPLLLLTP
jgi:hypothetical protein